MSWHFTPEWAIQSIREAVILSREFRTKYPTCMESFTIIRVDFVPRKIQSDTTKSAFVHIDWPYLDLWMDSMRDEKGQVKIFARPPVSYICHSDYWFLHVAHNPIPDTELNIHQLAENARLLEEKVTTQEEIIKNQVASMALLMDEMKAANEKIDRLQETLYQVIGAKFDHKTESNKIYNYVNYMYHGVMYDRGWYEPNKEKHQVRGHTDADVSITADFSDDISSHSGESEACERIRNTHELCDNY
jgi:hypothetical protein